jgi:hypothetical protein
MPTVWPALSPGSTKFVTSVIREPCASLPTINLMGRVGDLIFVIAVLGGLAAWVILGLSEWVRRRPTQLSGMTLSAIGFGFASLSALLQIGSGLVRKHHRWFSLQRSEPDAYLRHRPAVCVAWTSLWLGWNVPRKPTPIQGTDIVGISPAVLGAAGDI